MEDVTLNRPETRASSIHPCRTWLWGMLTATHLGPSVLVSAVTATLAWQGGRGSATWWVLTAALAGQFSVGWSNDFFDADRDRRAGRNEKPVVAGWVTSRQLAVASVLALLCCVVLSCQSGAMAATVHLVAVMSAISYNVVLKMTRASFLPYAISFALLPAFVTLGSTRHSWPHWWEMLAVGLIGTGAHFVNAVKDLEADARINQRGLAHEIGHRASLILGAACVSGGAVTLTLGMPAHRGTWWLLALVLMVCAASVRVGRSWPRTAWYLLCAAAVVSLILFVVGNAGIPHGLN